MLLWSSAEHAILGVPLTTLMERDRAVDPTVTIPIFATQVRECREGSVAFVTDHDCPHTLCAACVRMEYYCSFVTPAHFVV